MVIDREALTNDAGQPYAVRHTWTIAGQIQADDTSAVVARILALERAFAVWGLDMALLDGSMNVVHALPSVGSLTGVRVTRPPSFPQGDGAQLSTFRDYSIVATCDYAAGLGSPVNPLKTFTETLAYSGGGPRRDVLECANALPQEQVINLFTAYRATQAGSAVGMFGYPPIPPPLFPAALAEAGQPTLTSPRLQNGLYMDFGASWNYRFVSAVPLVAVPNQWPASG